jgi:integrase/ribosomal protein L37E
MDREKYLIAYLDRVKKELPEPNRTYILEFLSFGKAQGLSIGRRLEQIRYLHRVSLANPKDLRKWEEKDVMSAINMFLESKGFSRRRGKEIMRFEKPYSENTILAVKIVLKSFFKWLYGNGNYPDCVKSVQCKSVKGVKVTERDVLILGDVRALVDACTTPRDRAFIWCLYESGGRRGELHKLRRKDVEFDENGAILTLCTEKTENRYERVNRARKVRINYGAYDLSMWLDSISDKAPDSFVWIGEGRKNTGKHLSVDSLASIVRKAVRVSGIKKKTWLHLFRHSRATELAPKLSDQAMRIYFGWSPTSEMPSHYSHLTDTQVDETLLESVYGIKKNNKNAVKIITCPRCKFRNINNQNGEFCHGCGFPLKSELAKEALERRKTADRIMDVATEYPELMAVLEKIIKERRI